MKPFVTRRRSQRWLVDATGSFPTLFIKESLVQFCSTKADFEQALADVNHSRFGLQAGLMTLDASRIMTAFRELEVGALIVGDTPNWRLDPMPYGGVKDSGLGREGIRSAIEEMTEPRMMVMTPLN